ncbi:MAG: N-acetylornithine carbamoyltransferase [Rhodothermia bacterium]
MKPSNHIGSSVYDGIISWNNVPAEEWKSHLHMASEYARTGAFWSDRFRNKSVVLVFMNPSLRTRCSMELAAHQLGAKVTTLSPGKGMWSISFEDGAVMDGLEAEHVKEAAGVLGRYYDAIGVRVFATMTDYRKDRNDQLIKTFASASDVPLINLESAWAHPCQALADAATLNNHFAGETVGKRFVLSWAYHPKALPMAVPNSALMMAARLGMDVVVARPETHALDRQVVQDAALIAAAAGGSVTETNSYTDAAAGADVIYAKAWGGPMVYTDPDAEAAARAESKDWRVTDDWMSATNDGVFMHCLPVRRNVVVDDSVLDGPASLHLTQAENRLHAQKAILEHFWTPKARDDVRYV